jgi:hypothetical protein
MLAPVIDLDAARTFLHSHSRLLDRRRFQHAFDGAPGELVTAALMAYRNPDGGFGALEPDLRTPDSQPIPVRYAFDVLATLPRGREAEALARGALDWLVTVTNDDGGVPFVLPSALDQPAAAWMQPSPESSLLATAQLAAGGLRLELDHPWLVAASDYCWARVGDVSLGNAYEFKYMVDFLDAASDRARADDEVARLAGLMPSDGRIPVEGGADGEELDPLVLSPWPEHVGGRLLDPTVLDRGLDALEAGQQADGGWDFAWAKWNPAATWEWRGAVTIEALRTLLSYRRIK